MKSIQAFTTIADQAAAKYPKIVSDFYSSCVRSARFRPLQERDTAKKKCASTFNPEFESKLNIPNEVLVDYLRALAALAADDVVNFDPELNNLAEAFKGTGASAPQVDAVNGIAKFLFTAATEEYRREKLKQAIQTNDSDLQILSEGLKQIIAKNYMFQLDIEDEYLTKFYAVNIAQYQNQQPLTALIVDKQWQEEETALQDKKVVVQACVEVLDEIAKAHGELKTLYDKGEDVNSRQVIKTVLQRAEKLTLLLEDLRKAF